MSSSDLNKSKHAHPLLWMPTLYFAMGVPMITVSVVASIMYANLGLSNTDIGIYTGLMYLPWVIKPLWSPFVEMFKTKKFFVLLTEILMAACLGGIALSLPLGGYLPISLALFWIIGFLSATQDIAADGVYINAMTSQEQARYIGLQSICWYAGKIIASGALVSLTGYLHDQKHLSWQISWMVVMALIGGIMAILSLWHKILLPDGGQATTLDDRMSGINHFIHEFIDVWGSYFQKKRIWMMLAFIVFYRIGEGFLEKLGPLFMMRPREEGGLGLDNIALGNINGTFGSVAFMLGALIGGWIVSKRGLNRSLIFLCLMLNVPHFTFVYLSYAMPTDIAWITFIIVIEKLGYGIGTVALMLYMMQQVAPGNYKTAHYAISTGFMALCMMLTGMASGVLEEAVGYKLFFIIVMFLTIPSLLVSWLAPFPIDTSNDTTSHAGAGH